MRIVGAGFAEPLVNASWADSLGYEYELWSDLEKVIAEHYGVVDPDNDLPLRHAFILDEEGQAIVFHQGAISVGANAWAVLDDCRELFTATDDDGSGGHDTGPDGPE